MPGLEVQQPRGLNTARTHLLTCTAAGKGITEYISNQLTYGAKGQV
jgi:hypothetical protein